MDSEKKNAIRLYSQATVLIIMTASAAIARLPGLSVVICISALLGNSIGISTHKNKSLWVWISIPISCGLGVVSGLLYTSITELF